METQMESQKQVVLITGAGTGIGALGALALAAAGHIAYASMRDPNGRNSDKANSLTSQAQGMPGEVRIVDLDVLSDDSASKAVETIEKDAGRLDVVIHNAAHLFFGITEAFSADDLIEAFDVNCVGAHRVNRAALPGMRTRGEGLLLWIGSGTTRAIPPFLGPYTTAKAAFDALCDTTAWDIAIYGVETTMLMPGVFTDGTAHFAKAVSPKDEDRIKSYGKVQPFIDSNLEDTKRMFPNGISADPQIVADEIVRIVNLPKGSRPRRAIADGSDYGAEIVNGAAEQLRLRLARRMHVTGLLAGNDR
jgi:NAD(P)-dependent dehydrogenase (short-subunit alcohol dehydrogenase family)